MKPAKNPDPHPDTLWLHLRELPYFRALMRAVEASFYPGLTLPAPTLDVGCGDGHFVTVAFQRQIEVGIDPALNSLKEAARRGGYARLFQADGAFLPFPNDYFASGISNSVLEHIPHVEAVLSEIQRVLQPGAPFVFCGPNPRFLDALSISNWLDRLRLKPLGDRYRAFFNRISRHYNSDSEEVWGSRLAEAGFSLDRCWNYYAPDALQVTEWGHYFGLPTLFWRLTTRRWILAPERWNLWLTERYTRRHFRPEPHPEGVCTFYVAHKN